MAMNIPCIVLAAALFICNAAWAQPSPSPAAVRLAELINSYRAGLGLAAIALSLSLTRVAEAHVRDLEQNSRGAQCNMHSWSAAGAWSSCCYTDDHAQARCMWAKPREITRGGYPGDGFEIAHGGSRGVTPEGALQGWKRSQAHHEVIVNKGIWSTSKWQAMGVAVSESYALVWFGEVADAPAAKP
jgi:uncharacterized protein YkwD